MSPIPLAYLSSYLLSVLGNSIAGVALPLIVLQTTGSALGAGVVAAATAVPAVLAGLLMGVVIDRINRRTSSVITDLISAAAVAALPLVDMISGLTLAWFVLFGIIGSLGDVPGLTARDALLPAIIRHTHMEPERLMGLRESFGAMGLLLGPAAAGGLMTVLDGSTVLWITAATSAVAALLTMAIPHRVGAVVVDPAAQQASTQNGWTQLRDGWRVLARSRFLLSTTTLSVFAVVVLAGLQGLVLPVFFTSVDRPGMLGFVLTAIAAGSLVGAGVYAGVGARARRRTWLIVGLGGTTIGLAVIAPLFSTWVVLAGAFVVGLANGAFAGLIGILMIERVPDTMRGRIMGTQNAVVTAAPPIGIMGAALLTEFAGVEVAALVIPLAWVVAIALVVRPLLGNLESERGRIDDDRMVSEDA
ncbi:MFS transporter [Gordonia soli]|uniref:Multidrug efflux pump Tap n=1 Tax=Gordonia soli NBRC 108243 TaxID=1223545 RepID=M0QJD3_9ACTN|nr:MFS transporter [Gordonia soli]GAC68564.1 putative major facilitator superfamily transporter [Gordonia soli NBRC 108243]